MQRVPTGPLAAFSSLIGRWKVFDVFPWLPSRFYPGHGRKERTKLFHLGELTCSIAGTGDFQNHVSQCRPLASLLVVAAAAAESIELTSRLDVRDASSSRRKAWAAQHTDRASCFKWEKIQIGVVLNYASEVHEPFSVYWKKQKKKPTTHKTSKKPKPRTGQSDPGSPGDACWNELLKNHERRVLTFKETFRRCLMEKDPDRWVTVTAFDICTGLSGLECSSSHQLCWDKIASLGFGVPARERPVFCPGSGLSPALCWY